MEKAIFESASAEGVSCLMPWFAQGGEETAKDEPKKDVKEEPESKEGEEVVEKKPETEKETEEKPEVKPEEKPEPMSVDPVEEPKKEQGIFSFYALIVDRSVLSHFQSDIPLKMYFLHELVW